MSISLSRILVATDFSPSAKRALKYADMLADMFRAELHLLHVVMEPLALPAPDGAWIQPEESVPRLVSLAEQELATSVSAAELHYGSKPIRVVEVGFPVEQILKYADDKKVDLIIVGTQGHRGLSRLLLGSVAEKLVRLSKCPVLTVHAD